MLYSWGYKSEVWIEELTATQDLLEGDINITPSHVKKLF
tara:strand:+ start:1261 stop:1377 length:117 start_codon:yes stop_codon:yes gene_type:complete